MLYIYFGISCWGNAKHHQFIEMLPQGVTGSEPSAGRICGGNDSCRKGGERKYPYNQKRAGDEVDSAGINGYKKQPTNSWWLDGAVLRAVS